jgi:hypothetical protein
VSLDCPGPFADHRGGALPKSSRFDRRNGQLPGTLQRSCREAQELFAEAYDTAVRVYGEGDQADRAAYAALKEQFEKRGDHWIAKYNTAA